MKLLLTICMTAVLAPAISFAQRTNPKVTRAEIKSAEQDLSDAGFWPGPIDGVFDAGSRSALIAFQKWHGREITGQLTIEELDAIKNSAAPKARELGYAHVEVDLDRQVLMLVDDNGSVRVLPTSTGNGQTFMDDGQQSISYTPRGRFLVYDKSVGWEKGPLGSVYYPNYISGGVAIHGSRNVPNQPASHGCIRIPVFAARELSKLLKVGTIVLVYDKVSFVSAKDWAMNPHSKQAALAAITAHSSDYVYEADTTKTRARTVTKKPRSRIIRT